MEEETSKKVGDGDEKGRVKAQPQLQSRHDRGPPQSQRTRGRDGGDPGVRRRRNVSSAVAGSDDTSGDDIDDDGNDDDDGEDGEEGGDALLGSLGKTHRHAQNANKHNHSKANHSKANKRAKIGGSSTGSPRRLSESRTRGTKLDDEALMLVPIGSSPQRRSDFVQQRHRGSDESGDDSHDHSAQTQETSFPSKKKNRKKKRNIQHHRSSSDSDHSTSSHRHSNDDDDDGVGGVSSDRSESENESDTDVSDNSGDNDDDDGYMVIDVDLEMDMNTMWGIQDSTRTPLVSSHMWHRLPRLAEIHHHTALTHSATAKKQRGDFATIQIRPNIPLHEHSERNGVVHVVSLGTLSLRNHTLSSDEQVLSGEVEALYNHYRALNVAHRRQLLFEKIAVTSQALKQEVAMYLEDSSLTQQYTAATTTPNNNNNATTTAIPTLVATTTATTPMTTMLDDISSLSTSKGELTKLVHVILALDKPRRTRLRATLRSIRDLELKRNVLIGDATSTTASLLKHWHRLKTLRTEQGFVVTSTVIKVRKVSSGAPNMMDSAVNGDAVHTTLLEMISEVEALLSGEDEQRKKEDNKKGIRAGRTTAATKKTPNDGDNKNDDGDDDDDNDDDGDDGEVNEGQEGDVEDDNVGTAFEVKLMQRRQRAIKRIVKRIRANATTTYDDMYSEAQKLWPPENEPEIIPILKHRDDKLTSQMALPDYERVRQHEASQLKAKVSVFCNNKQVAEHPVESFAGSTMTATINTSFVVQTLPWKSPRFHIEVRVSPNPNTTKFTLLERLHVDPTYTRSLDNKDVTGKPPKGATSYLVFSSHRLPRPPVVVDSVQLSPTFCSASLSYALGVQYSATVAALQHRETLRVLQNGQGNTRRGHGNENGLGKVGHGKKGAVVAHAHPTQQQPDPNDPRNAEWVDVPGRAQLQQQQHHASPTAHNGGYDDGGVGSGNAEDHVLLPDIITGRHHFRLAPSRVDLIDLDPVTLVDDGADILHGLADDASQRPPTRARRSSTVGADLTAHDGASTNLLQERVQTLLALNTRAFDELMDDLSKHHRANTAKQKDKPRLRDVVEEKPLPRFKQLGDLLKRAFAQRRPLRPARKRQQLLPARLHPEVATLHVRVGRAFNVPSVDEEAFLASATHRAHDAASLVAHTKLCIAYRGNRFYTKASLGDNPTFNEDFELEIPVQAIKSEVRSASNPNQPSTVLTIRAASQNGGTTTSSEDNVFISLVRVVETPTRVGQVKIAPSEAVVAQFSLPVRSLFSHPRLQGTFAFDVPFVLHGFTLEGQLFSPPLRVGPQDETLGRPTFKSGDPPAPHHQVMMVQSASSACRVALYFGLNPPVRLALTSAKNNTTHETKDNLAAARAMVAALNLKFDDGRCFEAECSSLQGYSVLLYRYLHPIRFSSDFPLFPDDEPVAITKLLHLSRFCSLISVVDDDLPFEGAAEGMWATAQQVLTIGVGDVKELAVTFACIAMGIDGVEAYVLLGSSVPEGDGAYVLTVCQGITGKLMVVWNPATGDRYVPDDTTCPLQHIGTAFNNNNIWFNTQSYHDLSRVSFDFDNSKHWSSLRSSKNFNDTTLPREVLEIRGAIPPPDVVRDTREALELYLKNEIEEWRHTITRWNEHISSLLLAMLDAMEENVVAGFQCAHPTALPPWAEIQQTHTVKGMCVSGPPLPLSRLVLKLKESRVWEEVGGGWQFSLAVKLVPYPCNLYASWVYFTATKPS